MKKLIIPAFLVFMSVAINASDIVPFGQTATQNQTILLAKKSAKKAKKARKAKKGKKRGRVIGKTVSQLRAMGYSVVYYGPTAGGWDEYTINGVYYIVDENTGRVADTSAHAFRYGD